MTTGASRPPADETTRRRVVEGITRGCAVEAGAGTGKTTLLVERALALLASPKVAIEKLAIVTFTEKAAGELKVRLRESIERRIREGGEPGAAWREALEGIDRATLTTIHAFAASLLRERPVEAGVDPRFRVFDALESQILRDEAFERFWSESLQNRDTDLEPALRLGVRGDRIRALASFAVENRDMDPPPAPPDRDKVRPLEFAARFKERVTRLERLALRCEATADPGHVRIRALATVRDGLAELEPDAARLRILSEGGPRKTASNRANWAPAEALAEVRELFAEMAADHESTLALFGADVAFRLGQWLRRFAEAYEETLRKSGGLDFQGLLLTARDLLRDNPEARTYFRERYEYLLVDEFQDTDPLQAAILFFLSGESDATDWRRVVPRAGRMFIVGDPKQSIYRFRRADIAVYREASGLIAGSPGGGSESITVNFRTVPGIVAWVNEVFRTLFDPKGAGQQPPYTPIEPYRPPAGSDPPVTLVPLPASAAGQAGTVDGARAVEAAMIAGLIERVVREGSWNVLGRDGLRKAEWGDFALLFRGLTGLDAFEEALRARDLPYRVIGGRSFYRRQETRHLHALLRAVENPHDALSVAAALRSPFFGCTDEDLFLYVGGETRGGRFDYLRDADAVPEDTPVGDAFRLLREIHLKRNDRPPAATVEELLDRTSALALVLLRPQGEQRAANLLKTVELARLHDAIAQGGFRSFVRFLSSMEEEDRDESESPTVEDRDQVVRLMTVHQAKGLEFPIVVLADAAGRSRPGDGFCIDRRNAALHFSLRFPDNGLESSSWGYEAVRKAEEDRSREEMCRLLYVAATRARDHLVIPVVPHKGQLAAFAGLLRDAGALPPEGWRQGPLPDSGPLAHCRIVDPGALQTASPESDPFRLGRAIEGRPGACERYLSERKTWQEARRSALDAASRGRPIRTASSLEGGLFAPDAEDEAALVRPAGGGPSRGGHQRARGRRIGVAVHAVLEACPPGGDPPEAQVLGRAVAAAAAEAGLTDADEGEITRLVRAARATSVPARLARCGRFTPEFPFSVMLRNQDAGDILLEGRIDLLIEEPGGCVLVDYKTDRVPEGEDPATFVRQRTGFYRPQAAAYAAAIQELGVKVRSALLVFLDAGRESEIEADAELLALGRRAALTMPADSA